MIHLPEHCLVSVVSTNYTRLSRWRNVITTVESYRHWKYNVCSFLEFSCHEVAQLAFVIQGSLCLRESLLKHTNGVILVLFEEYSLHFSLSLKLLYFRCMRLHHTLTCYLELCLVLKGALVQLLAFVSSVYATQAISFDVVSDEKKTLFSSHLAQQLRTALIEASRDLRIAAPLLFTVLELLIIVEPDKEICEPLHFHGG